ncbi:MAG: serine/threonine protein kinase, partial [Candidatus Eremiobacteraeota bacterium]|nr:serine/threonine protein kinase [Candidatus Eremiobacteraeota bacterium]
MEAGRVLQGRYEVLEYLGQGETGTVHLCKDLHLPGKQWAVKRMTSGPALGREVEIMLGLRHRNLPAVIDHFSENGENFLVLEFVEGENLTTTVGQEGPINEFEALRWAVQISRVLGYLHSLPKPVLFRDLRPERVIVTPDRHIKLVDFGLARYLEPGQRGTQSRGAVAYTAPEQHHESGSEDPRSDLYSLGATLFFALTGKAPNPTGNNNLARLAPQLSRGTVALIERCLEPKPERRFPSADSVTLRL